jgi:hypothetical protein
MFRVNPDPVLEQLEGVQGPSGAPTARGEEGGGETVAFLQRKNAPGGQTMVFARGGRSAKVILQEIVQESRDGVHGGNPGCSGKHPSLHRVLHKMVFVEKQQRWVSDCRASLQYDELRGAFVRMTTNVAVEAGIDVQDLRKRGDEVHARLTLYSFRIRNAMQVYERTKGSLLSTASALGNKLAQSAESYAWRAAQTARLRAQEGMLREEAQAAAGAAAEQPERKKAKVGAARGEGGERERKESKAGVGCELRSIEQVRAAVEHTGKVLEWRNSFFARTAASLTQHASVPESTAVRVYEVSAEMDALSVEPCVRVGERVFFAGNVGFNGVVECSGIDWASVEKRPLEWSEEDTKLDAVVGDGTRYWKEVER